MSRIRTWPTPRSCEAEGGADKTAEYSQGSFFRTNKKGVRFGIKLRDAVGLLPTPTANDHKGAGKTGKFRDRLDYAAERGRTKSKTYQQPKSEGALNPDWVELLMGWPLRWSSLEPITEMNWDMDWSEWEKDVPRVTKGTENRAKRLKAIGNGQVSLCTATAWRTLT